MTKGLRSQKLGREVFFELERVSERQRNWEAGMDRQGVAAGRFRPFFASLTTDGKVLGRLNVAIQ